MDNPMLSILEEVKQTPRHHMEDQVVSNVLSNYLKSSGI
jgi:hypothetical protein